MVNTISRYTQSFLHTQIGQLDKRWWIGIHAELYLNGDTDFVWQNGDVVEYDNWNYGQPSKEKIIAVYNCNIFDHGGRLGFTSEIQKA